MKLQIAILMFLLVNESADLHASVWQVGPTRQYAAPSAVAGLVADGDTVEIDAGLYTGDVAKWFANNLLLRSVGAGYAHLDAGGNNAEGKAIWVIKGNDCTVEGIEFSGCQVPDFNGAGIRQEGKNLTLRNCYFHNNEMGILTSNDGVSDYLFEFCEFAENGYGDGYSHNIYVGHVNSLTLQFCYSHDAHIGHLVKSRAKHNYLYFNRLTGENGDGSYEVDLPNGGEAVLIGNIIEQSANSQNGGIVSFGLEGATNPEQQIVLAHNTLVNNRFDGRFVQFSNQTAFVKLGNNLVLGPGQLLQGTTASLDTVTNLRLTDIASAMLEDPTNFDFRPTASSPGVDAGSSLGDFNGISLTPVFQYEHPMAYVDRIQIGLSSDVGAFEFKPVVSSVEDAKVLPAVSISPNPTSDGRVNINFSVPLSEEIRLRVMDLSGRTCIETTIPQGEKRIELRLETCPNAAYLVEMKGFEKQLLIKM